MKEVPKDIAVALDKLHEARNKLSQAQSRYEAVERRLIDKLKGHPVIGAHPLVAYHIINTEERQLTETEIAHHYRKRDCTHA